MILLGVNREGGGLAGPMPERAVVRNSATPGSRRLMWASHRPYTVQYCAARAPCNSSRLLFAFAVQAQRLHEIRKVSRGVGARTGGESSRQDGHPASPCGLPGDGGIAFLNRHGRRRYGRLHVIERAHFFLPFKWDTTTLILVCFAMRPGSAAYATLSRQCYGLTCACRAQWRTFGV